MSSTHGALRAPGASSARPRLELVRRRSRSLIERNAPRRFAPVVVVAVIVALTAVGGVLLEQVVLAQSAFKMSRLRGELGEAETRHQELLLEATKLESPRRIERFARRELRLVEPPTVNYLVSDAALDRHGSSGRRSARRAAAPYVAVQPSARLHPSAGIHSGVPAAGSSGSPNPRP